jgi:hypothetical protein
MPPAAHSFWPHVQHYRDTVLSPPDCFADKDLQQSTPVCDRDGCPVYWTGGSAIVFRLRSVTSPERSWAVKCFKKPLLGRQQRYRLLSQHLRDRGRLLRFMVEFQYLRGQEEDGTEEQGILIEEEWFPVVKMDWVEGKTLREIVDAHREQAGVLRQLCFFCEMLAAALTSAELAHLDLQHGNVLWVVGDSPRNLRPKLIDYDGMWTPSLAGLPSGEFGVPHYQHPERHPSDNGRPAYHPEADRFSHLVIYTALRSLTVLPDLWKRYDNGDNLVFRQEDFHACRLGRTGPKVSPLLRELWNHDDDNLRWLAGRVILAANGPLQVVPELKNIVADGAVKPLTGSETKEVERICPWLRENEEAEIELQESEFDLTLDDSAVDLGSQVVALDEDEAIVGDDFDLAALDEEEGEQVVALDEDDDIIAEDIDES